MLYLDQNGQPTSQEAAFKEVCSFWLTMMHDQWLLVQWRLMK